MINEEIIDRICYLKINNEKDFIERSMEINNREEFKPFQFFFCN
jgi:hypothetical protein